MVVVADSSPLIYLSRVGVLDLVATLFGDVVVPRAVEESVVRRAWAKVHAENDVRDSIRAGMKATAAFEKYRIL